MEHERMMRREETLSQLVGDVMQKEVVSVLPDEAIQSVAELLMKRDIHAVPVVDADRHVVGIITETDFFLKDQTTLHLPSFIDAMRKTLATEELNDMDRVAIERVVSAQAKDIMTAKCVTVYEGASLEDLLMIFVETHYKSIPVVSPDDKLIGIVTLIDVLARVFGVVK